MTFYDLLCFLMCSQFEHHRDESYTHTGNKVRFRLEYSRPSAYHSSQNKKARRFVHKQSLEAWRDLLQTNLSWKQDDVNTDVDRYA